MRTETTIPARVNMDGNIYTVTNDGERAYLLEAVTVTFNGKPGTPIEEVRGLAEITGSEAARAMLFTKLRWGVFAFDRAMKDGTITPA